MFHSIMLIVGGLFACYGIIISKAPHLKDEFDKIIPFQGIFGIILIILGLVDLTRMDTLPALFDYSIILGLLQIVNTLTKFVLGFVLSYGLVTKYLLSPKTPEQSSPETATTTAAPVSHDLREQTQEATQKIYNTLIVVQVPFGILAMLLGLIGIVFNIIY